MHSRPRLYKNRAVILDEFRDGLRSQAVYIDHYIALFRRYLNPSSLQQMSHPGYRVAGREPKDHVSCRYLVRLWISLYHAVIW